MVLVKSVRYGPAMTQPKAIIFDLDGTLIHSAPDLRAAANTVLAELGRDTLDLPTVISFIGNGIEKLVERSLNATGGSNPEVSRVALERFKESYGANMTTLTRPYPGVIAALTAFRSAGLSLGICTNKPAHPAQAICDQLKLSQYFDVITGATPDVPKKPDPQSLLSCCAQLGVRPDQALYVGDSGVDYHTALNAHIRFRLYTQGYLNDALPDLAASDQFSDWADHGIPVAEPI